MIKACIDTNVWISGVLFSGKPAEVVSGAFAKRFEVVLSKIILDELEENLLRKFNFSHRNTKKLLNRILQVADLYEPTGSVKVIQKNHKDNLVLETAVLGGAKYLVTGDRTHLLPLKVFRNVKVLDSAHFVEIIKRTKSR